MGAEIVSSHVSQHLQITFKRCKKKCVCVRVSTEEEKGQKPKRTKVSSWRDKGEGVWPLPVESSRLLFRLKFFQNKNLGQNSRENNSHLFKKTLGTD